jgi:hypothetical protein
MRRTCRLTLVQFHRYDSGRSNSPDEMGETQAG